ncbi:MAG: restriction endonuclease subunit S, partial [Luteolibacter sp.]
MSRSPDPFLVLGNSAAKRSSAPKGRNIPAQGIALGNRPPTNPSPEGAAQGWRIVKLEDVADIRSGNGFPIKYQGRTEGEFPFFKVGDISRNWQKGMITLTNGEHCLTQAEVKAIRAKTLPAGSVVFAKIGAAVALNRRAILGVESLVDNNVMALVPSTKTTSRFLFYFMCQVDLGASTRGGAVPSLRRGDVADLEIPLPPLPEQRRIVARIEELFSRLDAGVAALRHAKAQLQRYRQSVLAAAVTGQLTQAWREQHPDTEPAEELLKRILRHRREQWSRKGNYSEPDAPDISKMPEIPTDWKWARLDSICAIGSGMSVSKNRKHKNSLEVPYLRVANVQRGHLVLNEVKRMEIEKDRLPDLALKEGDVLFNEGGDRDKLGRGWVWEGQIETCITQNHVFRASAYDLEATLPKFLSYWGNIFGQQFFLDEGTQTTNLASINKGVLSSFPIPIP